MTKLTWSFEKRLTNERQSRVRVTMSTMEFEKIPCDVSMADAYFKWGITVYVLDTGETLKIVIECEDDDAPDVAKMLMDEKLGGASMDEALLALAKINRAMTAKIPKPAVQPPNKDAIIAALDKALKTRRANPRLRGD